MDSVDCNRRRGTSAWPRLAMRPGALSDRVRILFDVWFQWCRVGWSRACLWLRGCPTGCRLRRGTAAAPVRRCRRRSRCMQNHRGQPSLLILRPARRRPCRCKASCRCGPGSTGSLIWTTCTPIWLRVSGGVRGWVVRVGWWWWKEGGSAPACTPASAAHGRAAARRVPGGGGGGGGAAARRPAAAPPPPPPPVPALPPAMSPTTPLPASIRVPHQPPARTPTHCHRRLVNSPRVRSCPTLHPPSRLTTLFPPCHACSAGRRPAHLQHHPQRNSGGRGEAPRLARLRQPHRRSEAAAGHSHCVHLPR